MQHWVTSFGQRQKEENNEGKKKKQQKKKKITYVGPDTVSLPKSAMPSAFVFSGWGEGNN